MYYLLWIFAWVIPFLLAFVYLVPTSNKDCLAKRHKTSSFVNPCKVIVRMQIELIFKEQMINIMDLVVFTAYAYVV